jgi:methylaspartate ammonia-lyase
LKKKFNSEEERIANKQAYMRQYRQDNKVKLTEVSKLKQRKTRATNKAKAVAYLGGKCTHCDLVSTHLCVYDFHHVDMNKKEADPGSLLHHSWTRIQNELDKCILLCANCHRIEHEKDNNV